MSEHDDNEWNDPVDPGERRHTNIACIRNMTLVDYPNVLASVPTKHRAGAYRKDHHQSVKTKRKTRVNGSVCVCVFSFFGYAHTSFTIIHGIYSRIYFSSYRFRQFRDFRSFHRQPSSLHRNIVPSSSSHSSRKSNLIFFFLVGNLFVFIVWSVFWCLRIENAAIRQRRRRRWWSRWRAEKPISNNNNTKYMRSHANKSFPCHNF